MLIVTNNSDFLQKKKKLKKNLRERANGLSLKLSTLMNMKIKMMGFGT